MLSELLTAVMTDGTLTIYQTDECAYHVQYENKLAAGNGTERFEVDGAVVVIRKGAGDKPEELEVTSMGQVYITMIDDHTTGAICVPYWMGA